MQSKAKRGDSAFIRIATLERLRRNPGKRRRLSNLAQTEKASDLRRKM